MPLACPAGQFQTPTVTVTQVTESWVMIARHRDRHCAGQKARLIKPGVSSPKVSSPANGEAADRPAGKFNDYPMIIIGHMILNFGIRLTRSVRHGAAAQPGGARLSPETRYRAGRAGPV